MSLIPVKTWTRTFNQSLDDGVISSTAPTAVLQSEFVGHPTGTLLRCIVHFHFDVRIGVGGTPPPTYWFHQVHPEIVVQFDAGGPPGDPADPSTGDDRILIHSSMTQRFYPTSGSDNAYSIHWQLEPLLDTNVKRKGAGVSSHSPTVTAFLWTHDPDNWMSNTFWDHRKIDRMGGMSVLWGDTF